MVQSSPKHAQLSGPETVDNRRAAAWILFSVLNASVMSIMVRELSESMDSRMIVMLRATLSSAILLALVILIPRVRTRLKFTRPGQHLLRGTLIGFSTHLGFYTLSVLPLATVTVLFFTAPIFATILAGPVHGEKAGPRRWSAVIAGFIGAVVILRPGFDGFHIAMLAALGSSLLFAVALTMSRNLARADGAFSTFASSVVITAVISAPLTAGHYAWPHSTLIWSYVGLLLFTAAARGVGDIQAYRFGDAGLLAPITYLRLIFLTLAGYLIWGEVPDTPTFVGAAIIVTATLYIARREAALRRLKRH